MRMIYIEMNTMNELGKVHSYAINSIIIYYAYKGGPKVVDLSKALP